MQEINDELINNFFNGLCTKEEAVKVLEYLRKHPDHHYLLDEWNAADGKTPLPGHYTASMYNVVAGHINKENKEEKRDTKLKLLWRIAAAACVIGVFISVWISSVKDREEFVVAEGSHVQHVEWTQRQNTQDTAIALVLADGSRITLSPKAYIRYRKDFGQYDRRDIYMEGEAFFEVAKNKQKPFTVYSGYISTTALGTAFRVTAENGKGIKVRLIEGKVVVAVTDTVYKKMHTDYYLSPGEELVFDTKDKPGTIYAFLKKNNTKPATKTEYTQQQSADESYMFNNQTLADVLDNLAVIYKVKIDYSKTEIKGMYFIGRIDRNEPLEKTIQDIALLNKLSVKKQNGGFILKRKKH